MIWSVLCVGSWSIGKLMAELGTFRSDRCSLGSLRFPAGQTRVYRCCHRSCVSEQSYRWVSLNKRKYTSGEGQSVITTLFSQNYIASSVQTFIRIIFSCLKRIKNKLMSKWECVSENLIIQTFLIFCTFPLEPELSQRFDRMIWKKHSLSISSASGNAFDSDNPVAQAWWAEKQLGTHNTSQHQQKTASESTPVCQEHVHINVASECMCTHCILFLLYKITELQFVCTCCFSYSHTMSAKCFLENSSAIKFVVLHCDTNLWTELSSDFSVPSDSDYKTHLHPIIQKYQTAS